MSSQPLIIRSVGCCEYDFCEQVRELNPGTPFNMSRNMSDPDPDKCNDKFALPTIGLIISAISLGVQCSIRSDSTGMYTFSILAFPFHAIGFCTIAYVMNFDKTPPAFESAYPPERTRCRSDTSMVYSTLAIAFSIFSSIYIKNGC